MSTGGLADWYINQLIKILEVSVERYHSNYQILKSLDAETQDILHEIEFMPSRLPLWKGYYIARDLQRVRQERRRLKVENETLYFIHDMVNKNPTIKSAFIRTRETIRRKECDIAERFYKPRVRGVIDDDGENCTENSGN